MSDWRDRDGFGGRVKRYARVSTSLGGLAARTVGGRLLGIEPDRGARAARLRDLLGGLKGPVMKVAQMLATIPEALPAEYAAELAQLQANAPAMGWPFVKRRMAAELGRDWRDRFDWFERKAAAAASLGQVHKAMSHDGRLLACKLQYPDMGAVVEADLRQLRLALAVFSRYDKAIDPTHVQIEIAARLREELDYRREARHLALYRHMLAGEDGIEVPLSLDDLSSPRLLTMTWLDGLALLDGRDRPPAARNLIARRLFRAWYAPFHRFGVIHGDPHLGNYTVSRDDGINLLDFGCIRIFPSAFIGGVIELYRALQTGDRERAVHAYETWGFTDISNDLIETMNLWARFAYGPLLDDRVRPIQETAGPGVYGRDVAEEVHRRLRRLGPISPPREFVFMDRATIGLGGVFLRLGAEINWHRLFEELIDGFTPEALDRRQARALEAVAITSP